MSIMGLLSLRLTAPLNDSGGKSEGCRFVSIVVFPRIYYISWRHLDIGEHLSIIIYSCGINITLLYITMETARNYMQSIAVSSRHD